MAASAASRWPGAGHAAGAWARQPGTRRSPGPGSGALAPAGGRMLSWLPSRRRGCRRDLPGIQQGHARTASGLARGRLQLALT
jgi:hypothetical protein